MNQFMSDPCENRRTCSTCGCEATSCQCKCAPDPNNEPVSSALQNFEESFFGDFTKTVVNGQIVWNLPCDLEGGIPGYPRLPGEGVACYIIRLMLAFGGVPGIQGPPGINGTDGTDGKDGKDGTNGKDGVNSITIDDEGVVQGTTINEIDFAGAGVTASVVGDKATVTIPSTPTEVTIDDEGIVQGTTVNEIDFVGNVVASVVGNKATVAVAYSSVSPMVQVVHSESDAVYGVIETATTSWRAKILNSKLVDTASIATLAGDHSVSTITGDNVTLPDGTYRFRMNHAGIHGAAYYIFRLRDITNSVTLGTIGMTMSGFGGGGPTAMQGRFVLASPSSIQLQYLSSSTTALTYGLGFTTGETQRFCDLVFEKEA
jgi:hypothetical protein